jgi:hypothetical protein
MSTTVTGAVFNGTATDADQLDGLNSTAFMRSNTNTATTGTLSVNNDTGLYVGVDSDLRLFVSGIDSYISNQTQNGDIIFQVNDGGSTTTVMTIDGATGTLVLNANVTSSGGSVSFGTGSVSLGNIINNNANGVGNIGSASGYFNTIFAKATSAEYADLAERFEADAAYPAGTVVVLGGEKEITASTWGKRAIGVISTNPAYMMNSELEGGVYVALKGRVPVKVIGRIKKGNELIAANNGYAMMAVPHANGVFAVALESSDDEGIKTIEALVL